MRRFAVLLVVAGTLVSQGWAAPPAHPQPIVSRIARQPVQSSALAAVGYSKHLRALEIEFVNGAIYRYSDVPPETYRELMKARSKAHFYDQNVRGHFRSVHVKPPRT